MQKDFEAQKIKLKSFIDENIAVSFDEHFCIHELIDTLQPPKPPTCSTCDHINLKCDSSAYNGFLCKNINALNADGDVVSTSGGYNIRIKNIDNFGCIHHSDYEVAE